VHRDSRANIPIQEQREGNDTDSQRENGERGVRTIGGYPRRRVSPTLETTSSVGGDAHMIVDKEYDPVPGVPTPFRSGCGGTRPTSIAGAAS